MPNPEYVVPEQEDDSDTGPADPHLHHVSQGLSLKKNFSFSFTGNIIYQASQWGILVVLAKLTNAEVLGQFALALAICTPITVLASMNLRTLQITDTESKNSFREFLGLRIITVFAAILVIAAIAFSGRFTLHMGLIIFVIGLNQCISISRDIYRAYMQKRERMDKVAVSQISVSVLGLLALTLGVLFTGDLLIGVIAIFAARLLSMLAWDFPVTRKLSRSDPDMVGPHALLPEFHAKAILKLAWLALPVTLMVTFNRIAGVLPQYFIEYHIDTETLGYFAAIAALPLMGNIVVDAAGLSALPRLSRQYLKRNKNFIRLCLKLCTINTCFGLLGIAAAYLLGQWILTIIFTKDYAAYQDEFTLLMVYGLASYIVASFNYGLFATRLFWIQPPIHGLVATTTLTMCWLLIPSMGVEGAVWAMIAGRAVQVPTVIVLVIWLFKRPQLTPSGSLVQLQ